MNNLSKLKVSLFTRLSAWLFMAITPEYYKFRRIKKRNMHKTPINKNCSKIVFKYSIIDEIKIRHAHDGKIDKPTIILLSPLPQSIYAYSPIWNKLIKKYNVFAYDMPGFGMSEGNQEYMHFKKQGEFLNKFIQYFNITDPHIIGPDIGMAAALHYSIHFPNQIKSLLIGDGPSVNPSINGSLISKLEHSSFWRLIFRIVGSETFVYAAFKLCYINYEPSQDEFDDYVISYKNRIAQTTKWFKYYSEGMSTIDPYLKDIDKPILIFWGDSDMLLLQDNAKKLYDKLKTRKLHIFTNCGHFSYQDKHQEFSELVDNWIQNDYKNIN